MKVLFVVGNVYPHDDANSLIVMRICQELRRIDPQIQVSILGENEQAGDERVNDIEIHRFRMSHIDSISIELNNFLTQNTAISRKDKIAKLLIKPKLLFYYLCSRIRVASPSTQYRNAILTLCSEEHFNAVVGVSFPFNAAFGVAKAGLKIPFIYYQLDPYFSHYLQPNKKLSIQQESFVCKKASKIILTDLIYNDYKQSSLKEFLIKSTVIGFPAIEEPSGIITPLSKDDKTHLLFLGTLYYDIRSPKGFLKMAIELIKSGMALTVDFVGPVVGKPDKETQSYLETLKDHVVFHGRVTGDEAKEWLYKSDVLVNIGNTIKNQMPSKIFEYFSTGKPILNFFKHEQCPTLKYTNRYPHCINIPEDPIYNQRYFADTIISFLSKTNDNLRYNDIEEIFHEFTTHEVGEKFYQLLVELDYVAR